MNHLAMGLATASIALGAAARPASSQSTNSPFERRHADDARVEPGSVHGHGDSRPADHATHR